MLKNLESLLGITQAIKGQAETQVSNKQGSTTTKGNISDEGMQRVIDKILGGQGGIRDISSGARGAGLYDSTTEQQLTNDLVARAAGEVAERQAGTTTDTNETITTNTEVPGVGLGKAAGLLGLLSAGKPLLEGALGLGGKTAQAAGGINLGSGLGASLGSTLAPAMGTTKFAAGLNGNSLSSLFGGSGGGIDLANVSAGSGLGSSLGTSLGQFGGMAGSGGGNIFSNAANFASGVPGAGSFLSGLLGGGDPNDMGATSLITNALAGFATAGPVGLLAAPIMAILGSSLGGVSVICTALVNKGLLDKDLYEAGREYLDSMPHATRIGYIKTFAPIAKKIDEGSKFWTYACLPFARGRTKLLASKSKFKYFKHPIGSLTKFVGEPVCYLIGKYKYTYNLGV